MARIRTLQSLLTQLRWQSDTEGAVKRHTDQRLVEAINQSYQAFRLMISRAGHQYYQTQSTGTLAANQEIIGPTGLADVVEIYGLDIQVGGEWRELFPFQFSERNAYQGEANGIPAHYRQGASGAVYGGIIIMPKSDGAYPWRLWHLPYGTELTATYDAAGALTASTSTFDGIAGWEDWLIYDTAIRVATRDAGVSDNFELLTQELGRIQDRILTDARKNVRNGPLRRIDTKGRRAALQDRNRWRVS